MWSILSKNSIQFQFHSNSSYNTYIVLLPELTSHLNTQASQPYWIITYLFKLYHQRNYKELNAALIKQGTSNGSVVQSSLTIFFFQEVFCCSLLFKRSKAFRRTDGSGFSSSPLITGMKVSVGSKALTYTAVSHLTKEENIKHKREDESFKTDAHLPLAAHLQNMRRFHTPILIQFTLTSQGGTTNQIYQTHNDKRGCYH